MGTSTTTRRSPQRRAGLWMMLGLMVTLPLAAGVGAEDPLSVELLADWVDDGNGTLEQGWIVGFDRALTVSEEGNLSLAIAMFNASGTALGSWQLQPGNGLTSVDATSYRTVVPITPAFGDRIVLTLQLDGGVIASRDLEVTPWNQPIADHEITLSNTWSLTQGFLDENGTQSYALDFEGRGWQRRSGLVLTANELGNGTLMLVETTDAGRLALDLELTRVWRNLTASGALVTNERFEMDGEGSMVLVTDDGAGVQLIADVEVVSARLNRSLVNGVVSEGFALEGVGNLTGNQDNEDGQVTIDGDVSLLRQETWDVGGVRMLDFSELQATADMAIDDGDTRFDLDVNELIVMERWESGVRVAQRSLNDATGTFGLSGEDEENGTSFQLNGTVYVFRQDIVDGELLDDHFHVDGTFSGSLQGSYGILNVIEAQQMYGNATDVEYPINLHHNQSWVNLSIGGFGLDAGTSYNETRDWTVRWVDWDNRTLRRVWTETGASASSGDEWFDNSPIPADPTPPPTESALGDINITREAGLIPDELVPGDRVWLADEPAVDLLVTALASSTLTRDGHDLPVTTWTGVYGAGGNASGSVVASGILAGLVGEVSREMPLDTFAGSVILTEEQRLERVLSPSIVTAGENSAPVITTVGLREGSLINEDGSTAHLEVRVSDPDWNVLEVIVDLASLGMGTVSLADDGTNGDAVLGDDVWTTALTYSGIHNGSAAVIAQATDAFDEVGTSAVGAFSIEIADRPPRLLSASVTELVAVRGGSINVSVQAEDAAGVAHVEVDWTADGGGLVALTETGSRWIGAVEVPGSIIPRTVEIRLRLTDGHGAAVVVDSGDEVTILNDGPSVSVLGPAEVQRPAAGQIGSASLSVAATDLDGVSSVQARLSDLAPPGSGDTWLDMTLGDDGNWSLDLVPRAGLPSEVTIDVRAYDAHGAGTQIEATITIDDTPPDVGGGDPAALAEFFSSPIVLIIAVVVILGGLGAGAFVLMRGGGFGEMMGDE